MRNWTPVPLMPVDCHSARESWHRFILRVKHLPMLHTTISTSELIKISGTKPRSFACQVSVIPPDHLRLLQCFLLITISDKVSCWGRTPQGKFYFQLMKNHFNKYLLSHFRVISSCAFFLSTVPLFWGDCTYRFWSRWRTCCRVHFTCDSFPWCGWDYRSHLLFLQCMTLACRIACW